MHGNAQIIRVIIVSFLITLFLGPVIIPLLKRLKVGQSIRGKGLSPTTANQVLQPWAVC